MKINRLKKIYIKKDMPSSRTMKDISDLETITFKWSRQISEYNHDTNGEILKQICNPILYEKYAEQILYVVSVIELLGYKYIRSSIALHINNFMINDEEFFETINKYTEFQRYNASSFTIIMRKAAKVIHNKYFLCTNSFSLHCRSDSTSDFSA